VLMDFTRFASFQRDGALKSRGLLGLQPHTFHSSKCSNLFGCRAAGLLLIQFTKNHTRHWLSIASTQAINFATYPPSQRHTFTIAAARHLLCNFRRHCPQQTLANGSSTGLKSLLSWSVYSQVSSYQVDSAHIGSWLRFSQL